MLFPVSDFNACISCLQCCMFTLFNSAVLLETTVQTGSVNQLPFSLLVYMGLPYICVHRSITECQRYDPEKRPTKIWTYIDILLYCLSMDHTFDNEKALLILSVVMSCLTAAQLVKQCLRCSCYSLLVTSV